MITSMGVPGNQGIEVGDALVNKLVEAIEPPMTMAEEVVILSEMSINEVVMANDCYSPLPTDILVADEVVGEEPTVEEPNEGDGEVKEPELDDSNGEDLDGESLGD